MRFDVLGLKQVVIDGEEKKKQEYVSYVGESLVVGRMEKKWKMMKLALVESATEVLGKVKGSQLDWFCESEEVISPYIK